MKDGMCPKCQTRSVMPSVEVVDRDEVAHSLKCRLTEPKDAGFKLFDVTHTQSSDLRAWICGACGYTELYAVDFAQLATHYHQGWR